jgi:hypothetical protein
LSGAVGVGGDVLTARALGRATLARQLLLARSDLDPEAAVAHLVGLQAQLPQNPYTGLWSRLARFRPEALSDAIAARRLVRIAVMRSTLHLVTADDALVLRPLAQPVFDAELDRHPDFGPPLRGVDLTPVLAHARALFAERPRTGPQLRTALAERFPGLDAAAAAYACRNHLALVQVPPRGLWRTGGQVTNTTVEAWLGRPVDPAPSLDDVVLRYLGAFGPATAADVTAWCRLPGMAEVLARLAPRLRPLRDERGRELVDLPDAPRPDPDVPAPPRFLPEYDNVVLSHADRSRFQQLEHVRVHELPSSPDRGSLLVDGSLAGTWWVARERAAGGATPRAELVVHLVARIPKRALAAVEAEGRRLLRFLAPGAAEGVVAVRPPG